MKSVIQGLSILVIFVTAASHAAEVSDIAEKRRAVERILNSGIHFKMVDPDREQDYVFENYCRLITIPYDPPYTMLKLQDTLLNTLRTIQASAGQVVLDCSMFVQVAALFLTGRADKPGVTLFPHTNVTLELVPRIFKIDYAYVRLTDREYHNELQRSHFINKGQWLVEVERRLYLGLTGSGVKMGSGKEWMAQTKNGLFREIDRDLPKKSKCDDLLSPPEIDLEDRAQMRGIFAELFEVYRRAGLLSDWSVQILRQPARSAR